MDRENNQTQFHKLLQKLMDTYVHCIYDATLHFPQNEIFGVTSQLRRAALSVVLNYTEGYARRHKNILRNFLEISYGSLKESRYLLSFSYKRKFFTKDEFEKLNGLADRIGRMIWGILEKL